MECKYDKLAVFSIATPVLIETLWNVNKGDKGDVGPQGPVLIETLWNVNHNSERFCFRSTTY